MTDPKQPVKSHLYGVLKEIRHGHIWTEQNQPWLNVKPAFTRQHTEAAALGTRAGRNGRTRNLSMSDFGDVIDCEKAFAASYAGIDIVRKRQDTVQYLGKSGELMQDHLETLLPETFVTNSSEKARGKYNRTWVHLPPVGYRNTSEITGKKRDEITGQIDGYLPAYNTGFELKMIPKTQPMPTVLSNRYIGQGAAYMAAIENDRNSSWSPDFWMWLFLPQDLRGFIPEDASTYRVYVYSADELRDLWRIIEGRARRVAAKIDMIGYEKALPQLTCYLGEACTFCN